ncbi:formate-dependent phosphoribosylglycinamide formyltransferase [Mycobacterium sp. 236(2023)]|uniref:formate-dependent phosphoribosylglycinamide formyltransferase n=1 Tax=Mycobacterium sp. 236(2023) TaxID=3038163 RepID=UPI00241523F5|nr:formate-dependent phosphoribosylglycinamide formyltransferase [Mycobacterium sp. 236(2023)]MDG4663326.1 formate-dependent phosphoribosylglycinamide formyltransferase [Mycobacterium sp. 236(2023)]
MSAIEAPHDPGTVVMLLGASDRSGELALAFTRLGADVVTVDDHSDVTALIEDTKPRYVVADVGSVATDVLVEIAGRDDVEVFPTPRSARLSLDGEGLRRLAADELGLPTAPFWFAGSVEELTAIAQHAGFPLVVKPVAAAPGEGESVLLRAEDVEPAWRSAVAGGKLSLQRVIAETVVEVDVEVTLLTVRTTGPAGPTVSFCEPIGHHQTSGEALESWQPQQLSPAALDSAKSIAARIVNSLGGRGVFAVELLVRGDEVYFSDVRPRMQDSGMVTLRSQRLSQFELHARAILGLPVDTIMISPGAVEIAYAGDDDTAPGDLRAVLAEALAVAESDVRLLPGGDTVATATAPDPIVARDRARRVASALRRLRVTG